MLAAESIGRYYACMKYELSGLTDLYAEYEECVAGIDPEAEIQIPVRAEIAADRFEKAKQKLTPQSTVEEFENAKSQSYFMSVNARRNKLIQCGFGGALIQLFEKIDVALELTEEQDEAVLGMEIKLFNQIPPRHRKEAKIVEGRGYYYGGKLFAFLSESDQ